MNGFLRAVLCASFYGLFCLLGVPGGAAADNHDYEGPYVKLLGGLNFALDSDYDGSDPTTFPSGKASLDAGPVAGLAGGYRFNRSVGAELEYVYRSNDIDKIKAPGGAIVADGGDLASVAIMANGFYFLDTSERWSPYLGIGVGLLQEIDSDVQLVGDNDQTDLEDEVFAWQAMVGAEVPIDERWRFFGEGRFLSAPGPTLANSAGSYDVDYQNLSVMVGLGYQF
jgi:opacity protein-like surface antigen